ncbi:MAG: DegT/DnrJ/EryC1/StrS family aminotransferase [Myxococcota bacterium]
MNKRILMAVPHMGGAEEGFVREAFATNWLSTVGPNIDAFEEEFSRRIGLPSVALGSGTAAIHLGLRLLGVGPGDEVLAPTLTFVASVNPVAWLGGRVTFVDSDRESWNIDPQRLADTLDARARAGKRPKAVIVVHLYGQSADMDPILEACRRHDVPVLEDAAEALGATYKGRPAGSLAPVGAFSFNGNKIITTTGGGMLVAHDRAWVDKARFWSTQARNPGIAYEHTEAGYNYRLSNVLAGIGRGQLLVLDERVRRRREIAFAYRDAFADLPALSLMPQAPWGVHTNWLSVFLVDADKGPIDRDALIRALDAANVESRPVWKPMHLQPLFRDHECVGGEVAADLFRRGICLPSSSNLTEEEQAHVIATVRAAFGA